jgi:hypothetical protein
VPRRSQARLTYEGNTGRRIQGIRSRRPHTLSTVQQGRRPPPPCARWPSGHSHRPRNSNAFEGQPTRPHPVRVGHAQETHRGSYGPMVNRSMSVTESSGVATVKLCCTRRVGCCAQRAAGTSALGPACAEACSGAQHDRLFSALPFYSVLHGRCGR